MDGRHFDALAKLFAAGSHRRTILTGVVAFMGMVVPAAAKQRPGRPGCAPAKTACRTKRGAWVCRDLRRNRNHCGGCDRACGNGERCRGGKCIANGTPSCGSKGRPCCAGGACAAGLTCGADKRCEGSCTPLTKAQACAGRECGTATDPCSGATFDCGSCSPCEQCREDGTCAPDQTTNGVACGERPAALGGGTVRCCNGVCDQRTCRGSGVTCGTTCSETCCSSDVTRPIECFRRTNCPPPDEADGCESTCPQIGGDCRPCFGPNICGESGADDNTPGNCGADSDCTRNSSGSPMQCRCGLCCLLPGGRFRPNSTYNYCETKCCSGRCVEGSTDTCA